MLTKIYDVTLYLERGEVRDWREEFTSLAKATHAFHTLAGHALANPDACVTLCRVTSPSTGTVLASKSTDGRAVEFSAAFYVELRA